MANHLSEPPGFPLHTTKQSICDNTLEDARLEATCPLDNSRHANASAAACYPAGQLDQLPAELLVQVLLRVDIPSLTHFRRVNRRAMDLVDSVPEYAAVIRHCPNIIRAIVSIQADAFDCGMLYQTLSTSQCSTCERFGDHLYLVSCRRACYFCFTRRLEYLPLTMGQALRLSSSPDSRAKRCHTAAAARRLIHAANPPSILSLPGRYTPWAGNRGSTSQKRLQLLDRPVVAQALGSSSVLPPRLDKTTSEPRRFMAIVTAPYLFDAGRQADWGFFCLGCREETEEKTRHFRIKYTREGLLEHAARYGPAKEMLTIPGRFIHCGPS